MSKEKVLEYLKQLEKVIDEMSPEDLVELIKKLTEVESKKDSNGNV